MSDERACYYVCNELTILRSATKVTTCDEFFKKQEALGARSLKLSRHGRGIPRARRLCPSAHA
jgi:hypothetical protein